ncbi:MAG: rhodanese-related sulfurtransferase [Gammaproteobacteria bacterium]|jgi:rhodanese-related sulfurtransferase
MKNDVQQMMAAANAVIDTIAVHDAINYLNDSRVVFIDLRENSERQQAGLIPGAVHAPRGLLEFYADPSMPMHKPIFSSTKKLVLFCAKGGRSILATKTLIDMGLTNVKNMAGGFAAWKEAGGTVEKS